MLKSYQFLHEIENACLLTKKKKKKYRKNYLCPHTICCVHLLFTDHILSLKKMFNILLPFFSILSFKFHIFPIDRVRMKKKIKNLNVTMVANDRNVRLIENVEKHILF
jgi:hypothetical protein